jgi:hypothetical protein
VVWSDTELGSVSKINCTRLQGAGQEKHFLTGEGFGLGFWQAEGVHCHILPDDIAISDRYPGLSVSLSPTSYLHPNLNKFKR